MPISIVMNITCPFCFETFRATSVMYRCVNPHCSDRGEDRVLAEWRSLKKPPVMGKAFLPKEMSSLSHIIRFATPAKAVCPICTDWTNVRICPNCHFELRPDAGMVDDYIISVIGGREAGKGHYITTLVNRLQNELGKSFSFNLSIDDKETKDRYEEDYYGPLFRKKSLIQPTHSAQTDARVKTPMIFRLTIKKGILKRDVNLIFFDSAGEDMKSLNILSSEAKYICFSSGIIFLLDPLQIDQVRPTISPDQLPARDITTEPVYLLERLRELFEQRFSLPARVKVKTPVAFTISKTDTLYNILPGNSVLKNNGLHPGYFNFADGQKVQTEIESFIHHFMGDGFLNRARAGFQTPRYFGISSLGCPPTNGRIQNINPIRVEDPFLWILAQLNLM